MLYVTISAIVLFLLACLWRRDDLGNFLIKIVLFGLAGWGGFLALQIAGYIIQT